MDSTIFQHRMCFGYIGYPTKSGKDFSKKDPALTECQLAIKAFRSSKQSERLKEQGKQALQHRVAIQSKGSHCRLANNALLFIKGR